MDEPSVKSLPKVEPHLIFSAIGSKVMVSAAAKITSIDLQSIFGEESIHVRKMGLASDLTKLVCIADSRTGPFLGIVDTRFLAYRSQMIQQVFSPLGRATHFIEHAKRKFNEMK